MCPLCRVKLQHSSSHTSAILSDNQPAHHNQSRHSHIWTDKKAFQTFTYSAGTKGTPVLSHLFYTSTRWPRTSVVHSQSRLHVSTCSKLRSCPWLEVLKCIIHQLFWEMLTAQFAPGIIHLFQYVAAMLKHGEIKISGMSSPAPTQMQ